MSKKLQDNEYWERQAKETDPAWEAFKLYRDMEGRKSARRVAEQLSKAEALIRRWSARHHWRARVMDYERWKEEIKRKAKEKELDAQGKREVQQGKALQALGQAQLTRFKPDTIKDANGNDKFIFREKMSAFDARMCMIDGSRLVNKGLGEADSKHELEVKGKLTFKDLAEKARNARRKRETESG